MTKWRRAAWLALALWMFATPAIRPAAGEETAMLADVFLERAGVAADAALRDKVEAFLEAQSIDGDILAMIPDGELAAYAVHLRDGWPIDYAWLTSGDAGPLPDGADFSKLRAMAVTLAQGVATPSFVADFELGVYYMDGAWPVPEDVCRAERHGTLTEALRAELSGILADSGIAGWQTAYVGDALAGGRPVCLALAYDAGVTRYTAVGAGSGAPVEFMDVLLKLYEAVAAADSELE